MQGNKNEEMKERILFRNLFFGFLSHIKYTAIAYFYAPFTFVRRVLFCKNGNDYNRTLFLNRWGFIPRELVKKVYGKKTIWIDALSGGEITQIVTFCKLLKEKLPDCYVILSTNNDYSMKFAKKHLRDLEYIFDSPWDIRWVVKRVLKKINPQVVIFVEGAYLPVLARQAHRMNIKTVLVSALMRKKWLLHNHYFYRRYFFLKPFNNIDYILVKSKLDRDCLVGLNIEEKRIFIQGNLKFDTQFLSVSDDEVCCLKKALRIDENEFVLVAGSVHPKEESLIIDAYQGLRLKGVRLRLIIVPRYNHFIPDIVSKLNSYNFPFILRSNIQKDGVDPDKVVIVDTFGELMYLYALSSIIVIGGSFFLRNPCGFGQNIVEPLLHFKPIFFGPYMGQFKEITDRLLTVWGGMEIRSSEELSKNIECLLNDKSLCQNITSNIKSIVSENSESAIKSVNFIKNTVLSNARIPIPESRRYVI